MKKNFLTLVFAASALTFAACAPSPADVAKKVAEHKELSQTDYRVASEYTLKAMENISDTISKYEQDPLGLATSFKNMMPEYEEGNLIIAALQQADPSSLDSETKEIYDKAMALYESNARRFAAAMGYSGTPLDPDYRPEVADENDGSQVMPDSVRALTAE